MITSEQYYWFVRRQQLLKAWKAQHAVGAAVSRSFKFEKPIASNSYLFVSQSDGLYNEDAVNEKFENYAWPIASGRCSSARWKNWHGRNYDWYFDQAPTVILTTPKTATHKHATLGVATLMHMKAVDVKDGWNPYYEFMECAIVDGINDAGLACNLNVVPPGDNPNYPTLESENTALAAGLPIIQVRNVTYGTAPGKPRRFVGAICRTILDNCATVQEVKEMLSQYSWYAARNPHIDFNEEFHAMVSDLNSTLVIEFVENKVVWHEWTAGGTYVGCSDPLLVIGKQVLPIMTNFYLSKWNGELADLGISRSVSVAARNPSVTEYGMGYERYQVLDAAMKNATWTDVEFMEKLMREVQYRQIYIASADDWTSEFLLRGSELNYRADMLNDEEYISYRARAKARCEQEDADDARGVRPDKGVTWQTVHNATYDLDKKTLTVFAQEDYENQCVFSLKQ